MTITGTTTPARLRRLTALLVLGCLLTAIVSALAGSTRADATGTEGTRLAAVDFDAGELYGSLNGANASAATGFGTDRTASPTMLARYDSEVTGAFLRIQHAAGLLGQDSADAPLIEQISYELPRYTSAVDAARALRDQGSPRTQAQLASAQDLMSSTILPAADTLQQHTRSALADDFGQAGAFPLLVLLVGVLTLLAVGWVSVRESRRTKRLLSPGLAVAAVLLVVVLAWWLVASLAAAGQMDTAGSHNEVATSLSQARVDMLEARAAETAAVAGGATGPALQTLQSQIDGRFSDVLRAGGLLDTAAGFAGAGSAEVDTVRRTATTWQSTLRDRGIGSDESRVAFVQLTAALGDGVSTEQGARADAVAGADSALTGIAIGPAVLALLAGAGVAVGVGVRLREYAGG